LVRDLLRLVEHARQGRRQIDLPGAAAGDFRKLGERGLDRRQRLARTPPCPVDQSARQTLGVVEQNPEQTLVGELLVALAQGQRLGGLNEAAGAVRILLEVHFISLGLSPPPWRRGWGILCGFTILPSS